EYAVEVGGVDGGGDGVGVGGDGGRWGGRWDGCVGGGGGAAALAACRQQQGHADQSSSSPLCEAPHRTHLLLTMTMNHPPCCAPKVTIPRRIGRTMGAM